MPALGPLGLPCTDLQAEVADAIARLGGYWRPSAAALRLLEELGEVGEAMNTGEDAALANELADVVVISICLANQFLSVLDDVPAALPAAPPTARFAGLVAAAGRLAKLVNFYDGPKTPRPGALLGDVAMHVNAVHAHVHALAAELGLDLRGAVRNKLAAALATDVGRFAPSPDPSTAPVLRRWADAVPDGGRRLWGAPDVVSDVVSGRAHEAASWLVTFAKAGERERLDGYVLAAELLEAPPGAARVVVAGVPLRVAVRVPLSGPDDTREELVLLTPDRGGQ